MPERPDVVDRADALMRGRRSFVIPPGRHEPTAPGDDEDLPVLTEVVLAPENASVEAEPVATAYTDADLAALGAEMAEAITQQLNFELPTLIEAAMARASEELRAGIASTIDDAVREFIAQHRRRDEADKGLDAHV